MSIGTIQRIFRVHPVMSASIALLVAGLAQCCILYTAQPALAEPALTQSDLGITWRFPQNAATNCLYVQLRQLGYAEPYDAFYEHMRRNGTPQDFESLEAVARDLGYTLVPAKLTTTDLASLPSPVIIYMEYEGIRSGTFELFVGRSRDGKAVEMFEGATMRWILMPEPYFRRAWTGYALLPARVSGWWTAGRRFSVIVLLGYTIFRVAKYRKWRNNVVLCGSA